MKALGIDIGTTTLCGIVIDGKTGIVLESRTLLNDSFLDPPHPSSSLQDADKIISRVISLADSFLETYDDVAAIGLTGQMHGILYTDQDGLAVSPLFTWQDGCGNLPAKEERGETYASLLSSLTGHRMATGYGLTTHYFLTKNHGIPDGAVNFCTIADYAVMRLCKRKRPLLTPSHAAGTGLFDLQKCRYDAEALAVAGLEPGFLPEVTASFSPAGTAAKGIPVAAAIGDNQASVLGSVTDSQDSILVNVGTGSQISVGAEAFLPDSPVELRPLTGRDYIFAGSSLCGGRSYALLEHFFRETASMIAGRSFPNAYDIMAERLKTRYPKENPLDICTQFCGTRQDPALRGSIRGLTPDNFTPEHFILGTLDGIAGELYGFYERLLPYREQKPTKLVGSGNGLRKNVFLQKLFEEAFRMKLSIPLYEEEASFGAALYALTCAGYFPEVRDAQRIIRYRED